MAPDLAGRLAAARSWLFVPGDRPERFGTAVASGADVVVLDLEDAVATDRKASARDAVAGWAASAGGTVAVRVNAVGTPWHGDDLAAVRGLPVAVVLARATPESVRATAAAVPGVLLVALVETAAGVLGAAEVAAGPGVVRLALGTFDLAAQLGVSPDDREALLASRSALVLASAAAGLPGPVDGVTAAVGDEAALQSDLTHGSRVGMRGKLCVHPRQVAGVHLGARPDEVEVAWARRVLDAVDGEAVTVVDGDMVDRPVLERARQVLARARP